MSWCTTTNSLCQSRPDGLFFGVRMDYSGIRLQKTAGAISIDVSTGKMTSHITATALYDHSPIPHFTLWRNCTLFDFPSTKGPYCSVATILRVQASIYRRRYVLLSTYTSTAHAPHTLFQLPSGFRLVCFTQMGAVLRDRKIMCSRVFPAILKSMNIIVAVPSYAGLLGLLCMIAGASAFSVSVVSPLSLCTGGNARTCFLANTISKCSRGTQSAGYVIACLNIAALRLMLDLSRILAAMLSLLYRSLSPSLSLILARSLGGACGRTLSLALSPPLSTPPPLPLSYTHSRTRSLTNTRSLSLTLSFSLIISLFLILSLALAFSLSLSLSLSFSLSLSLSL